MEVSVTKLRCPAEDRPICRLVLRTPLCSPVLLGRARAAAKSGDREGAAHWYGLLAGNWKAADPDLPELAEVRAGAKGAQASR